MFKKKKFSEDNKISTLLGKDTHFKGTLSSKESVRIEGIFEGEISTEGDLFIGEGSKVSANLKAKNVLNSGEIYGNIEAQERVEITPTGKIYGDIKAESLLIEEGAVLKGQVNTEKEVPNRKNEKV